MDLYIDRENLKSIISSCNKDENKDCIRMLNRHMRLIYNMDKDELKTEELLPWVKKMGDGQGDSEKDVFLPSKFPIRPIKSNSYNDWKGEKFFSVYLINDVNLSKLKDKGYFLLGGVGEEFSTLKRLFCGSDYSFHYIYDLQNNFKSWQQLVDNDHILPCTDIVINDRYIFSKEIKQTEFNLKQIFSALSNNTKGKINIVIYTYIDNKQTTSKKFNERIKENKIIEKIEKIVENKTGFKPNVTIVTSSNKDHISHDRFIITNYRLFRSGDSFIYFVDEKHKETSGVSLDVDSIANHEVGMIVNSLLKSMQNYLDEIKELNNPDLIVGKCVSNFLTFPESK